MRGRDREPHRVRSGRVLRPRPSPSGEPHRVDRRQVGRDLDERVAAVAAVPQRPGRRAEHQLLARPRRRRARGGTRGRRRRARGRPSVSTSNALTAVARTGDHHPAVDRHAHLVADRRHEPGGRADRGDGPRRRTRTSTGPACSISTHLSPLSVSGRSRSDAGTRARRARRRTARGGADPGCQDRRRARAAGSWPACRARRPPSRSRRPRCATPPRTRCRPRVPGACRGSTQIEWMPASS